MPDATPRCRNCACPDSARYQAIRVSRFRLHRRRSSTSPSVPSAAGSSSPGPPQAVEPPLQREQLGGRTCSTIQPHAARPPRSARAHHRQPVRDDERMRRPPGTPRHRSTGRRGPRPRFAGSSAGGDLVEQEEVRADGLAPGQRGGLALVPADGPCPRSPTGMRRPSGKPPDQVEHQDPQRNGLGLREHGVRAARRRSLKRRSITRSAQYRLLRDDPRARGGRRPASLTGRPRPVDEHTATAPSSWTRART